MNRDIFVVSEYFDNGEPWCDTHHDEEPIAAFRKLESAERYCLSRGVEQEPRYGEHDKEYKVFKKGNNIQCPIDKNWKDCEQNYDEDFCTNCWDTNWGNSHDFSFKLLKIYRVCLFAESPRNMDADSKMEYSVSELPGGRIHGSLKGNPKEAAWMLEKLEHEELEQSCICNVSFGHIENVSDDVITDIVNMDRYINQVIINKKGGK